MGDPLSGIPPLIPLPPSVPHSISEESEDKFATLFSPPTPRATPTSSPKPDHRILQPKHVRQESDDFGSFVSVPSTQAPLVYSAPRNNKEWSFFEEAKFRDDKKRESFLAELDGPLFADTSVFEQPTTSSTEHIGDSSNVHPTSSPMRSLLRRSPTLTMSSRPPTLAPPLESTPSISSLESREDDIDVLNQSTSSLDLSQHARSRTDFSQSPPLLSSRRRSSHSSPTPPPLTSYSTLSALSSKWMSSLLSGNPSSSPSTNIPPTAEYHSSPFAPKQSYIPPSGAPGYAGDREEWDKGGQWYGALEKDLERGSQASTLPTRSRIPASFTDLSSNSRRSSPPVQRTMSTLLSTALPSLQLSGLQPLTTPVVTPELASALRIHLPPLRRLREKWQLLYSLDQHGVSLGTLYSRCDRFGSGTTQMKPVGEFASAKDEFGIMGRGLGTSHVTGITSVSGELGTVFAVQDSNGGIFGAWLGERLRAGEGGYFGSGESFLWKQKSSSEVEVFKWTGKNDYVALCDSNYISFGGGDGSYGIYLDSALYEGSSAPCPTFDNPPLCDGPGKAMHKFECVGVEVWGV